MTEFNMGIAGINYGKRYGIPTLSSYTTNFSQYLKYYNLDFIKKYSWDYMRWFHNQTDLTLCPSTETRELLYSNGIQNTGIFSRGIDTKKFSPGLRSDKLRNELGIKDKIVMLYVGRVAPEKDIDVMLEAYNQIIDKYRDKIALIITGDGPELDKYKKSFPKGTIFTGYKKGEELAKIYASSDIFVFPSPTETFGNVVLEAMASGLPVIAPNAGGVKDTVKDRTNGLMFNAGDSNKLALQMMELIEDERLRKTLSFNGRKTCDKRSWSSIVDGLIDTYEDVIYSKKGDCSITA
jgi:glycosyltransferase involved in cell wall biosynthesis